jgi:hypothetical protein
MFFNSKAKHVKKSLIQKTTSLGLVGLLVAAGLVATTTASQAEPVVTDIYCGEQSHVYEDNDANGPTTIDGNFVLLELNDFSLQYESEIDWWDLPTIEFAGGSTAQITLVDKITSESVLRVEFDNSGTPAWPVTLSYDFEPEMSISNSITSFRNFQPCSSELDDVRTENNDDAFDGSDIGRIKVGTSDDYFFVDADDAIMQRSVVGGVTNFSYTSERSITDVDSVDINVNVTFAGNTVTWNVESFVSGTSTPAPLTFFIDGNLGSDSRTVSASSGGVTYTNDRYYEDPVVVFDSNSSTYSLTDDDQVRFGFIDEDSGFLEVSVIGYDRCATEEEIQLAVDTFIGDYQNQKNKDQPDVVGAECIRQCQPSTATLERSPGIFDVGGIPLCFDTGLDSTNPSTLLEQEGRLSLDAARGLLDMGTPLQLGDSIEYQNVVLGGDVTLNASLTATRMLGFAADEYNAADFYAFRDNDWIQSGLWFEPGNRDRYLEYTLVFFVSGDADRTPVSISNLNLSVYDIDNFQFFSATGVDTYSLAGETILRARASGAQLRVTENNGISSSDGEESRVSMIFKDANSFVFRVGVTERTADTLGASYGLDFTAGEVWEEAPVENTFKPGSGSSSSASVAAVTTPSFAAKRTISRFSPESPRLLKAQRAEIRSFLKKNPELSKITCTGYTAGPVKRTDRALAKKRAANVCAYIETIKPAVVTQVAGRTPGLPFSPLSRKVIIRGYSITP